MNGWEPDTCEGFPKSGCIFQYLVDSSKPQRSSIKFSNVSVLRTCQRHSDSISAVDQLMMAHRDNWLRSDAIKIVHNYLGFDLQNEIDNIYTTYDGKEKMRLIIDLNINQSQKSDLQSAFDLQLGSGKVTLV